VRAQPRRRKGRARRGGDDAWVLGDVGPCGDFLEPVGDLTEDEVRDAFRDQIEALLEGGADAILVETMSDPAEMVCGIEAALACNPGIPVVATYAFQKTANGEFRTMMGTTVAEARPPRGGRGRENRREPTAAPRSISTTTWRSARKSPPRRAARMSSSSRMPALRARWMAARFILRLPGKWRKPPRRLLDAGARIVGGCCGTTPAHLAAIAVALK
jgi:5-methyltetrahydrofolate--homocysteine methyltransferase